MIDQFGISGPQLVVQMIVYAAVFFFPAMWATMRVTRFRSGLAVPAWLLFIWLAPIIGPVFALLSIHQPDSAEA